MQKEAEFSVRADPHYITSLSANIVLRLASYTTSTLEAQLSLTTKSLGMAAAAIDVSNDNDLRRWNRLAKLATEVVDARLKLQRAMNEWSDIVESEIENIRREGALLATMSEYDEVTKAFNVFGANF